MDELQQARERLLLVLLCHTIGNSNTVKLREDPKGLVATYTIYHCTGWDRNWRDVYDRYTFSSPPGTVREVRAWLMGIRCWIYYDKRYPCCSAARG